MVLADIVGCRAPVGADVASAAGNPREAEGRPPLARVHSGGTAVPATPVVAVVGASGAGKTRLIERLLPALRARGLAVGVMKHAPHGSDHGRPGSDSWRLARAGAQGVVVVGPGYHTLEVSDGSASMAGLAARHFPDADLVLAEGFTSEPGPKVLVHRRVGRPKPPPSGAEVILTVTDEPLGHEREVGPGDVDSLVEVLGELARRYRRQQAQLLVDGEPVPLNEFVSRFLAGAVLGLVGALKGISDDARHIVLSVRCPMEGGLNSE